MRDYGKVSPRFWNGSTGKALRAQGRDAQLVALYLVTCESASMTGLYYLPLPTLCHETGIGQEGPSKGLRRGIEGASEALRRVGEAGFARYDEAEELVWVPEMARIQIGESLQPGDKRIKAVVKAIERFATHRFAWEFFEKYRAAYRLPDGLVRKPLRRGFEAPSMPLRSQEQEQEQEKEQKQETATALVGSADGAVLTSREPDQADLVKRVFHHWQAVMGHPTAKLSPERRDKIVARLKDSTVEECLRAIDGCKASPHHMGQNESGTVYDDLMLILRNRSKLEFFVAKAPSNKRDPFREQGPADYERAMAPGDGE